MNGAPASEATLDAVKEAVKASRAGVFVVSHAAVSASGTACRRASQSVAGFVDYLKRLVVASADTLEPVDVSAVSPPTDDSAEPAAVD